MDYYSIYKQIFKTLIHVLQTRFSKAVVTCNVGLFVVIM